jgi:LPS sulfotransferase NodH
MNHSDTETRRGSGLLPDDDATIADLLAGARAAAVVGDSGRASAICLSLHRRFFEAAQNHTGFIRALLREELAGPAEALAQDFVLAIERAGQAEAQEALLADATGWFPDNPWFATEYARLAGQRGAYEEAAYRWEAVRSRWPDRVPASLPVPTSNDQAFVNLVAALDVDEAAFARAMTQETPSERNYIIVFSPRSGSTWLNSVLTATQLLGQPGEYINPAFVRSVAAQMNCKDPSGLLAMLRRRRKSPNGVFGIKLTAVDVVLFGEAAFFTAFGTDTVIFHLWRENLVAQGLSLYRAVCSGQFHESDVQKAMAAAPPYDAARIAHWVLHVANYENQNMLMLTRHRLCPRSLRYGDLVGNTAAAISIFADALGVDLPVARPWDPAAGAPRKLGDDWNRATELRFRREQAEFMREIERRRLIKKAD